MPSKKTTVGDLTPEDFLILSDSVRDDLPDRDGVGDLEFAGLAYPKFLKAWQVACLRWVFPSAEFSFYYTEEELRALPRAAVADAVRAGQTRHVAFARDAFELILARLNLDPVRHSRPLDSVVVSTPLSCYSRFRERSHATVHYAKFCPGVCGICVACSLATMSLVVTGNFGTQTYDALRQNVRRNAARRRAGR